MKKVVAKKRLAPVKTKTAPARRAALARNDDRARALIEVATASTPKDQVKTCAAALELHELAKAGPLSPAVALAAWRAGTCFNQATSKKATKGQQKLLNAAKFAHAHAFVIDNCRRWFALGSRDAEEASAVGWLLVHALLELGSYDEAQAEFEQLTPAVVKNGRAGKLGAGVDWVDHWFGTYLWQMGLAKRKAEVARATALRDDERARATRA